MTIMMVMMTIDNYCRDYWQGNASVNLKIMMTIVMMLYDEKLTTIMKTIIIGIIVKVMNMS